MEVKVPLLDQMRHIIRLKHMSYRTEQAYISWVRRFILFHHKRHPAEMGANEILAFLTHLAVESHVAASTQNGALNALLFLYRHVLKQPFPDLGEFERAKRPRRLPIVFTQEEVRAVLAQLDGVTSLMARLLYGAGLRLMECVRLRVKDLDFAYHQLIIRDGKGAQDRTPCYRSPYKSLYNTICLEPGGCMKKISPTVMVTCISRMPSPAKRRPRVRRGNGNMFCRLLDDQSIHARDSNDGIISQSLSYRKP